MKTSSLPLVALFILFLALLVNSTKLGIPFPIPPCNATSSSTCVWDTIIENSDVIKITVISHPIGSLEDKSLSDVVSRAKLAGVSVFGQIKTDLGTRSLVEVKAEIDSYLNLYKVDGFFFEEIPNDCSCKSYFDDLYAYVKNKNGGIVALNVGENIPECFGEFADIIVVFDSSYSEYKTYKPSNWHSTHPTVKFWHVVRGCPKDDQRDALVRAIGNQAGYVYLSSSELNSRSNPTELFQ